MLTQKLIDRGSVGVDLTGDLGGVVAHGDFDGNAGASRADGQRLAQQIGGAGADDGGVTVGGPDTNPIAAGQDILNLVLAKGYLSKLLENKAVTRYLRQRQPEVLSEFEVIVETVSLD